MDLSAGLPHDRESVLAQPPDIDFWAENLLFALHDPAADVGMWLHLGGGYWQRASYDAIVVVGAALSLIAVAPSMRHWPWTSWVIAGFIVLLCVIGLKLMSDELNLWQPFLERIESLGPVGS